MTTIDHAQPFHRRALIPGLALSAMLAASASGLHVLPVIGVLSPMTLSILLGMAFRNLVGAPAAVGPGVGFALRRVLRFAIILLGLQLTAQQVAAVGGVGVGIIAVSLLTTFMVTKLLGRLLGLDRGLAELIAAGTSICGASAVVAVNTVTGAKDEDVAYAIACVTVFGSIAMFVYPALPTLLHLSARAFGLWTGASIHEIAQVVAAAFQDGHSAGEFGTIAKLTRVSMLAPVVFALGILASRRTGDRQTRKAPMPWFVLGFVGLACLNSLITIPLAIKTPVVTATGFLLSIALAAMGLETDLGKLAERGLRPAALGAFSSLFIAGLSLGLIKLFA